MNEKAAGVVPEHIPQTPSKRIASIDWMRGFVMILMVIDHVSMAYNGNHNGHDSAAYYDPNIQQSPVAFLTRWATHLCAPTFVFLAGTALAISIERKVAKGIDKKTIDKSILSRGAFIALLDLTIVSLFSGRWTIQVLYAIGTAMMCMALFRRLSTPLLLGILAVWLIAGDFITMIVWDPGNHTPAIWSALLITQYSDPDVLVIKYPLIPWLMIMIAGWVYGRFILSYSQGLTKINPLKLTAGLGILCLATFTILRTFIDYGNAGMLRADNSWQWFLRVSKYPPSLTFTLLEIGLLMSIMSLMMAWERKFGSKPNGVMLVFGQTAMFFYLAHRIILEGSATYLDLRGFTDLAYTYLICAGLLFILYPTCLWYRALKKRHAGAMWTTYL